MTQSTRSHTFHIWFSSWVCREAAALENSWETSRISAMSYSSADFNPRRGQARSEMLSRHLVLCRPLGSFPMSVASMTCLANLWWDILVTWPDQRSWDLSIRKTGLTFRALWISQLRDLSRSVTPWTLRRNPVSAACTWDNILSVMPNIHDQLTTGEDWNKDRFKNWKLCDVCKLPFCATER